MAAVGGSEDHSPHRIRKGHRSFFAVSPLFLLLLLLCFIFRHSLPSPAGFFPRQVSQRLALSRSGGAGPATTATPWCCCTRITCGSRARPRFIRRVLPRLFSRCGGGRTKTTAVSVLLYHPGQGPCAAGAPLHCVHCHGVLCALPPGGVHQQGAASRPPCCARGPRKGQLPSSAIFLFSCACCSCFLFVSIAQANRLDNLRTYLKRILRHKGMDGEGSPDPSSVLLLLFSIPPLPLLLLYLSGNCKQANECGYSRGWWWRPLMSCFRRGRCRGASPAGAQQRLHWDRVCRGFCR